jgi:hypothetical protein
MIKLTQYFWNLMEQAPSLLTMLACLVFALSRWKRYPKVSLTVALSLALLILHVIVFMFVYDLVPPLFLRGASYQNFEQTARTRQILFFALGFISNFFFAIGLGLLLVAIFMQRKPAPPSDSEVRITS